MSVDVLSAGRALILLAALAGTPACTGAEPPTAVTPCTTCAPGEVRGGVFLDDRLVDRLQRLDGNGLVLDERLDDLAADSDAAHRFLAHLDREIGYRAVAAPDVVRGDDETTTAVVPGPDGGAYLLVISVGEQDRFRVYQLTLVATDRHGKKRWERAITCPNGPDRNVLVPDGRGGVVLYAQGGAPIPGAGHGDLVTAFTAEGEPRFELPFAHAVEGFGVTAGGDIVTADLVSTAISARDADGQRRWERPLGAPWSEGRTAYELRRMAVADDGRVHVVGAISLGKLTLSSGAPSAAPSPVIEPLLGRAGEPVLTTFIAELGPDGAVHWIHRGRGALSVTRLLATPTGALVGGRFAAPREAVSLAGLTLTASEGLDGIALELGADGVRWHTRFAGPGAQDVEAMALAPSGALFALVRSGDTAAHGAMVVNGTPLDGPGVLVTEIAR